MRARVWEGAMHALATVPSMAPPPDGTNDAMAASLLLLARASGIIVQRGAECSCAPSWTWVRCYCRRTRPREAQRGRKRMRDRRRRRRRLTPRPPRLIDPPSNSRESGVSARYWNIAAEGVQLDVTCADDYCHLIERAPDLPSAPSHQMMSWRGLVGWVGVLPVLPALPVTDQWLLLYLREGMRRPPRLQDQGPQTVTPCSQSGSDAAAVGTLPGRIEQPSPPKAATARA